MFQGNDLTKYSERQMQQVRGSEIAMIFQDPMTSLKHYTSFYYFSILWEDSHNTFHGNGFSGTGLSYYCKCLLLIQVKIHAAHSLDNALVRLDVDCKILNF